MIYEFRTYDLKPHSLPEVEKRFAEAYEIMLEGSRIVVKLNGKTTVDATNDLFTSGTIALQANGPGSAGGAIRFRNIRIRPI